MSKKKLLKFIFVALFGSMLNEQPAFAGGGGSFLDDCLNALLNSNFVRRIDNRSREQAARQKAFYLQKARHLNDLNQRKANGEEVRITRSDRNFTRAPLDFADLNNLNLEGANFRRATLIRVDFSGTNLKNVDFDGANVGLADFRRSRNLNPVYRESFLKQQAFFMDVPAARRLRVRVPQYRLVEQERRDEAARRAAQAEQVEEDLHTSNDERERDIQEERNNRERRRVNDDAAFDGIEPRGKRNCVDILALAAQMVAESMNSNQPIIVKKADFRYSDFSLLIKEIYRLQKNLDSISIALSVDECRDSISLESFDQKSTCISIPCAHIFLSNSALVLMQETQRRCPICRKPMERFIPVKVQREEAPANTPDVSETQDVDDGSLDPESEE